MQLIIIGSGTFIPDHRANSSYLLKTDDKNIIFDIGRGAINNLQKVKIDLYKINYIFISHTHADHLSELISLINLILDSPEKNKVYYKMLKIYGPRGIKKSINYLLKAYGLNKHKNLKRIEIKELKDRQKVSIEKTKIQPFYVFHNKHLIASTAYRIKNKNKIFVYSGDSSDCKGLREACKNANVAILESTLPKEICPKEHLSGEDAGRIAKDSNVKHLILTHIAKDYLKNAKKDAGKYFNGKITIARDLLIVGN